MNAPEKIQALAVYSAINAVQKALCKDGITKSRKNAQQGYSFRGIDDVYNALSPLLAENGLCILPRILTRACEERQTKSGSSLFYVTVEAEFDFVAASDGSRHTVRTFGEAMDSADKATNKAMSAAYKYAAFQAFAIPTEGDNDADAHTPPAIEPKKAESSKSIAQAEFDNLAPARQQAITDLGTEIADAFNPKAPDIAYDVYRRIMEALPLVEEQAALKSKLSSQIRTAFAKLYNERKALKPLTESEQLATQA